MCKIVWEVEGELKIPTHLCTCYIKTTKRLVLAASLAILVYPDLDFSTLQEVCLLSADFEGVERFSHPNRIICKMAQSPPPLPPDTATGYTLLFISVLCYTAGFGLISVGDRILTSVLGTILLSVAGSCVFTAFDTCFVSGDAPDRLGHVPLKRHSTLVGPILRCCIVDAKWVNGHVEWVFR